MIKQQFTNYYLILLSLFVIAVTQACSTLKSALALDDGPKKSSQIQNPFDPVVGSTNNRENIILRTKKGDRSVEVELPASHGNLSDFVVPVSPAFRDNGGREVASSSEGLVDEHYKERTTGIADREISSTFQKGVKDFDVRRQDVEQGLGVVASQDDNSENDQSYLAGIDHLKQLFRNARFEAALLETDELVRIYPTDPKIYEMRGTLFDRIGQPDLAIKAWNQSLRLNPENTGLKKFVDRKIQKRGVATQ